MSKNIYDIDKSIQLYYYDNVSTKQINEYVSGKYYIQQLRRIFRQKNNTIQIDRNTFEDNTEMILVKNDLNIKQQ